PAAGQHDALSPRQPARGQSIVEFRRGNPQNEGAEPGQFRIRGGPLGDIVNSQPVFVGAPKAAYLDINDPGYAAFKAANSSRAGRVYVGANDGMLHAFDDAMGRETWAYVARSLYRVDNTGLGALSY